MTESGRTLQKTRMMPPKKQMVPLSFCLREKNKNVFWGPMIRVRPERNRICVDDGAHRRGRERREGAPGQLDSSCPPELIRPSSHPPGTPTIDNSGSTHVSECEEGSVKEHDDTQHHKQHPERGQPDPNLYQTHDRDHSTVSSFAIANNPAEGRIRY